ncbi:endonuclease III [Butyrivibrio sp. MC2013]|uniref:endonuclease III n=1 Tax=Butyrivibrio sp. MC2013 TaxID=1280686 RepID=UPI00041B7C0E|nr:endonuclease III [Butyrivibrio sp. MC2013]
MFRRTKARLKQAEDVCRMLDEQYGAEMVTYLDHRDAFELLIATILSAQCTDKRVNMVTPGLFAKYPTVHDFAGADLSELEEIIHSVGFYHAKATNIIACAKKLEEDFGGEVPRTIEELTSLPGVGRKTANVIRGNIFEDPSIVVDTHVKRISKRLGLTDTDDPVLAEEELMKVLPRDNWIRYNIQIIRLGRTICSARSPKCSECFLRDICPARQ